MSFWKALTTRKKSKLDSPDEVVKLIAEFWGAKSWRETKRILEEHPELMEPANYTMMTLLAMEGDDQIKRTCIEHQDLLKQCREVGIEQAFSEKMKPLENIPPKLLAHFEKVFAANDIDTIYTLLGEHPELIAAVKGLPENIMVPPRGIEPELEAVKKLDGLARVDPKASEQLVKTYQQMLSKLPEGKYLAFRATIQNDLGSTYAKRRWGDRNSNLTNAIQCFQEALKYFTLKNIPSEYALTQGNLGNAFQSYQTSDPAPYLVKAIQCFTEALGVYNLVDSPEQYAKTLCELAVCYFNLSSYADREKNLTQAIQCYTNTLGFYTPKAPGHYGSVQYCLGECYRNLPSGNRLADLGTAIDYFQEALRYLDPKNPPYTITMLTKGPQKDTYPTYTYMLARYHLGEAYRDIPDENRAKNLELAVQCFREALRVTVQVGASPKECEDIQDGLTDCLSELKASKLSVPGSPVSKSAASQEPGLGNYQPWLHRLLGLPYHEALKMKFYDTFETLYKKLAPGAARMMGISEEEFLQQFKLTLSEEPRISASAEPPSSTITINESLMQFILRLLYLVLSQVEIETRNVPRLGKIPRQRLDELTLSLVKEFWIANGNISSAMESLFQVVAESIDDSAAAIPMIEDIYRDIGSFVVAHEMGHMILHKMERDQDPLPAENLARAFVSRLKDEGLVDQFARITHSDPGHISQSWSDELCSDAAALDLCLPQDPAERYLFQISVDLFFNMLHLLDLSYYHENQAWIPLESHPPAVARLVFARSVFRSPQWLVSEAGAYAGPLVDSDLPAAVRNLVEYLNFYLDTPAGEKQAHPEIKISTILPVVDPGPGSLADKPLVISKDFGELVERILLRAL